MKDYADLRKRLDAEARVLGDMSSPMWQHSEHQTAWFAERAAMLREASAALAALERERDTARFQHGAFPEEHAYMALLRLPITGALRATPEVQAAMATCVTWVASYLGQSRQCVQEYYEDRIAAEAARLSPPPSVEGSNG